MPRKKAEAKEVKTEAIEAAETIKEEAAANGEKLKSLGFTRLDFLVYTNPSSRKDISDTARQNMALLD